MSRFCADNAGGKVIISYEKFEFNFGVGIHYGALKDIPFVNKIKIVNKGK